MGVKANSSKAGFSTLEKRLGHKFLDISILEQATVHSSVSTGKTAGATNERLEFLGDRVLGLVVSEMLYKRYKVEAEGDLAKRHVALVRKETLAKIGDQIGLGAYVELSKSEEEMGGRANPSILSDCCEAVIAALYLDGGLEAASGFITKNWAPLMEDIYEPPKDDKTRLQEWAQAKGLGLPVYSEVKREGPSHAPVFTMKVALSDGRSVFATGKSKRLAEQSAAGLLLEKLENTE